VFLRGGLANRPGSGQHRWAALLRLTRCLAPLISGLVLLGCGHETDHGTHDEPDSECTGDFDTYEAGMSRQAEPGAVTVELEESEPAPPVVRRDNVWWLRLSDAEGEPLLNAELLVTPYMPKHQHGSAEVVVEELGDGRYKLSPIELIMPGVWEIPVSITTPEGETSEMTFRFCIAEL
jgi:hypothetical protein